MTENEKKKEYLKGYERACRQIKRYEEKIYELRINKMCPSIIMDGMPHSQDKNDLSSYAAKRDELWNKYMKERYKRIKICKEISDKIERMEDEDEKDVLMYRYIRKMKWEDIAVKMNFSWQHLHKIHARALTNFII